MSDSSTPSDPLAGLVDEFASRCRNGECPSVAEYVARHPQHAEEIQELLPAVAMMEQLRVTETVHRAAAATHTAAARPPQRIGDFRVIAEIGRGGMGVVYEAEQESLARRVAVKVLPKHALLLEKHLRRFRREAQTAARLHHTNIVGVFGVGEQDGLHYYVMPLVRGVGLDEVIRELAAERNSFAAASETARNGSPSRRDIDQIVRDLTVRKFATAKANVDSAGDGEKQPPRTACLGHWQKIAQIGRQAADALDYAHAQGTLHRDIKPANLLMDRNGVVYVADFGLARAVDQSDAGRSHEVVGTARYMAPEQFHGVADARTDIYALGLTLYELLTLRPLFDSQRHRDAGHDEQLLGEAARPRNIDPTISRDFEAIVLKCLSNDPARRYQTASALAADLGRFIEERPVRARRISAVERGWRWCRRNPALAGMAGLTALMLIVAVVTVVTGYLQTTAAYAETRTALRRTATTSQLAFEALENIYSRLSPQRVWIASDADPGGQACACIGLSAGDDSAATVDRAALQTRASRETALLLENLLVFHDRLAAQGGEDRRVAMQLAVARRRVGDIRLCLGQIDQAEEEYQRAVEKLTTLRVRLPADLELATELAHCHNEIGNVRSMRRGAHQAYQSHQAAFDILQSYKTTGKMPEEYRYELARTYYFLASKGLATLGQSSPKQDANNALRPTSPMLLGNEHRKAAIRILEGLIRENAHAPDYRLLLALCYQTSLVAPTPARSPTRIQQRQRAIQILEELTAEYPGVADYRYELIAAYAWTPVSLFPWQGRSAVSAEGEADLRKALEQSQRLVDQNPGVPHYARCQAIVLAKLATACWRARRLAEAEDLFSKALRTQTAVAAKLPEGPSHDRVLLEFLRLRLGQACLDRNADAHETSALDQSRSLIEQCIEKLTDLTSRSELAGDRLAWSSLPVAYETLSELLAKTGKKEGADAAKRKAKAIRLAVPASSAAA